MIQFLNNIIDLISIHIQGIAAITTLIFIFLTIINDKYDFTNEKCECGYKTDSESKGYKAWSNKQKELDNKFTSLLAPKVYEGLLKEHLKEQEAITKYLESEKIKTDKYRKDLHYFTMRQSKEVHKLIEINSKISTKNSKFHGLCLDCFRMNRTLYNSKPRFLR